MTPRTYETRSLCDSHRNALLGAYAELYSRAERTLFARLQRDESLAAVKREFLIRFGLTARQFNALAADLRGKIASVQGRRRVLIRSLERRIARAKDVLSKIPPGTHMHHQKRRRLVRVEQRLAAIRADDAAGRIRLCFGSRTLFRKQFGLTQNGYASHESWQREWRERRASQFFVLGSKDETSGCQGCVATVQHDGTITLRLRLPNALAAHGTHLVFSNLRFAYGHEAILAALGRNVSPNPREHEAISWRFVRDNKGWRVLATVLVPPRERVSLGGVGVVAVDLNADHLAVTELDRFGNPVTSFRVQCLTCRKSRHQRLASIGAAVQQVVTHARELRKPIVVEQLDFEAKKAELEQRGARYARMLSGFACAAFHALLRARAYDAGVELRSVNPAYTSVIGEYKFATRYGLSRHQAAAVCIGRRGMHLAERPNRRMGDDVAFPLPVRNRGKHVWSFWRRVAQRAAAHTARGRPGQGARSSPVRAQAIRQGTARRAICSSAAGGNPARESSAALFG